MVLISPMTISFMTFNDWTYITARPIVKAGMRITKGAAVKDRLRSAVAALALLSTHASAHAEALTTKCESAPLLAAFTAFGETGRMPAELARFLGDEPSNET